MKQLNNRKKRLINWSGKQALALVALCVSASAQTLTTIYSFPNTGVAGYNPAAGLVQSTNGGLYGTTLDTVFEITTAGKPTTVTTAVGGSAAPPIQATNGDYYGTSSSSYPGSVFKVTPAGQVTSLHTFCSVGLAPDCSDGYYPYGGLVQGGNGNFYGTTNQGGAYGYGTAYEITPGGTLATLHAFCSAGLPDCPDGAEPHAGLILAANGNFYGSTTEGGKNGGGTVFEMTPSGVITTLTSFTPSEDGDDVLGPLVQANNGDFYGATSIGGSGSCGAVFKVTPSDTLTILNSFTSTTDGCQPNGLTLGTDGNFYGTTESGGTSTSGGTVFKITPSGALTTLHNFCSQSSCKDGETPYGGLVQDTNGAFYGTTYNGGTGFEGTVFRLSVGLAPFIQPQPTFGAVGAVVKILGTNLTGATSVAFNGTAAVITGVSASEITTTVPSGATSGKLEVVTPSGTLSSNVPFRVVP